MDEYNAARSERMEKWEGFKASYQKAVASYQKTVGSLEDERKKLEQGQKDLQAKKEDLAVTNGGKEVCDSNILDINAGGQIVRVTRGTLTQITGSRLEALFNGRWEKQLHRDSKGRIFLDVNPTCFKCIVDYLNERKIAPPDSPPGLPKADLENQVFLDGLLTALGLGCPKRQSTIDSTILTDATHVHALKGFLAEDNHDTGLTLLYQGTRDGFDATSFHQKCDNQGPTVTVVRTTTDGVVLGGFSDISWTSSKGYARSSKAFLFGLSSHGEKVKLPVISGASSTVYHSPGNGPIFGLVINPDLVVRFKDRPRVGICLGNTYTSSAGGSDNFLKRQNNASISEIEVFALSPERSAYEYSQHTAPPVPSLTLDAFPEDIHLSFQAEAIALQKASQELTGLQEAFSKEQAAVELFGNGNNGEIALFNVSGCEMAAKHSTLAQFPDSVLYKQFADPKWTEKRKRKDPSPHEWDTKDVVAWSKSIDGLREDLSTKFQDVTGPELVALEFEHIKDLGIQRPGTVALVMKAIQKLREEDDENSVAFIEHSDYCFGKIIDHMRLKAMGDLGVPDPKPPRIRAPDLERFKRIVEYYFPNESAAEFLA